MKFLRKTAAVLMTALILSTVSGAVFAADHDKGNEWEAEEVNPVLTESFVNPPESLPSDNSQPVQSDNGSPSVTPTGDSSSVIPWLFAAVGAAAAVSGVFLKKQKRDDV